MAFAAVAATTAWLKHVGWITPYKLPTDTPNLLERMASVSHAVLDPRNLQAWGVALGLLSLVWVVARIVSLRRGMDEERLLQRRSSVDWCIRHGLVAMQWLLVACCTLAEVPRELIRGLAAAAPAVVPSAFGPTAWILLGVVAVMLIATLWERWRTAELVAVLLVAATLPCLIAGRFATDLAVASASRWTLAISFAVCSIAVWGRRYLADGCRRIHAGPFAQGAGTSPISGPRVARSVLLATTVLPVLAITVVAAMLQISGAPFGGPVAKTFFQTLGPTWSYLVPLVLLIGTLVGYALRERSSGYAFSAGMVLEMAVTLGYLLHAGAWGVQQTVLLLQWATITAAAWAILWLVARRWIDVLAGAAATYSSRSA